MKLFLFLLLLPFYASAEDLYQVRRLSEAGSEMNYSQATEYNKQAVFADILYGSSSDRPKDFKAGEQVARRIMIFFVEVTPKETAALAKSVRIESTPDGQFLKFKLPGGGESKVLLL